jgi:hypothetical protein
MLKKSEKLIRVPDALQHQNHSIRVRSDFALVHCHPGGCLRTRQFFFAIATALVRGHPVWPVLFVCIYPHLRWDHPCFWTHEYIYNPVVFCCATAGAVQQIFFDGCVCMMKVK